MRLKAKHMPIIITLILILMFLLLIFFAAVAQAKEVSDLMLPQMETQYEEKVQKIKEEMVLLSDSSLSDSTKKAHMQSLMADYSDSVALSYPIYCYSLLSGNDGWDYCWSRNAIILSRIQNGIEESIPLYFLEDDTADIPNVLTYPYTPDKSPAVINDESLPYSYATDNLPLTFRYFTYDDTEFYVGNIIRRNTTSNNTYYKLHETELESQNLTTCNASFRFDDSISEDWTFTSCIKSFGSTKFFGSNYTKGWKRTDELNKIIWSDLYPAINTSVPQPGIITARFAGTWTLLDTADLIDDQDYIRFYYVAQFSPFSIALKNVLRPGLMIPMIFIFIGAWLLLMTLYTKTRKEEVSALADEIARQEKALSYAKDAEASRREMTSAIAHELKTPIAVLSSYAEAARENIDPEKRQYYLDIISQQSQKMDQMVLELLDLSRLEAGKYRLKRENFDLRELCEDIIAPLEPERKKKNISLTWQVTDPTVNADRYRLGQIAENFMTNALRHTPEGGRIILRIGTASETFSVENEGSSIPKEQLKKVWETFWQGDASRSSRGSGLGLAICKSIVSLHGGSCKAENTALGVKFSVSLKAGEASYLTSIIHHEEIIELNYQIAQEYTTVENLMRNLGLIKRQDLPGEVKSGTMKVGTEPVTSQKQKLYPGYVLSWQEFRITVVLKDDDKRQAMMMEYLKGERGLASPYRQLGGACGGK